MIDYKNELNAAQYEAASTLQGPVLVIAGAGSGKTRTIVYRLAHLVESGIPASSILLLTFTRKASQEMLERAHNLLGHKGMTGIDAAGLAAVQGGTFHGFAYSILRVFRPEGYNRDATVMDSTDALALLQHCKEKLSAGKGDRSFPRNQTVMALLSKSRNREQELEDILRRESAHLLPHADEMQQMGVEYASLKREKGMLDYDDLLFELEKLLRTRVDALNYCRRRFRYIMVDEFQDTNLVQARITALIAGAEAGACGAEAGSGNIMAVGDDAQSIYAFRGANVSNILNFEKSYPGAKIIRLEENYRSTQPLLDLSNAILDNASQGYKKHLFTKQPGNQLPQVYRNLSDLSQGGFVVSKIVELLATYPAHEIAVLFRAGYQSYHVEVQLNKIGLRFKKYGGIRYADAAHIKDAMSFLRLVLNPLDFTAFQRICAFIKGIGPKTALKLHQALQSSDLKTIEKACTKYPNFKLHLEFLNRMRSLKPIPRLLLESVLEHYQPVLEEFYPDDYPKRRQGLDELLQIAASYADLDLFIADLSLDDPLAKEDERDCITLSTIHSAKGLEWGAVILIDLVEERFPSKHALLREDDYEEERRLMYVACTRAKEFLGLFVPTTLYDRGCGGNVPAVPSPFIRELSSKFYDEWQESYTGGWVRKPSAVNPMPVPAAKTGGSAEGYYNGNAKKTSWQNGFAADAKHESYESYGGHAGWQGGGTAGHSVAGAASYASETSSYSSLFSASDFADDACAAEHSSAAQGARKSGGFKRSGAAASGVFGEPVSRNARKPEECGFCTHKIFGRGKVIKFTEPDKYQVNFPGIGVKTIMGAFLNFEGE